MAETLGATSSCETGTVSHVVTKVGRWFSDSVQRGVFEGLTPPASDGQDTIVVESDDDCFDGVPAVPALPKGTEVGDLSKLTASFGEFIDVARTTTPEDAADLFVGDWRADSVLADTAPKL